MKTIDCGFPLWVSHVSYLRSYQFLCYFLSIQLTVAIQNRSPPKSHRSPGNKYTNSTGYNWNSIEKESDIYACSRYKDQENCFVHRLKLKESINNNLRRKQQQWKKKKKTNHQRQQRTHEAMSSENDVNSNLCACYCFRLNAEPWRKNRTNCSKFKNKKL